MLFTEIILIVLLLHYFRYFKFVKSASSIIPSAEFFHVIKLSNYKYYIKIVKLIVCKDL